MGKRVLFCLFKSKFNTICRHIIKQKLLHTYIKCTHCLTLLKFIYMKNNEFVPRRKCRYVFKRLAQARRSSEGSHEFYTAVRLQKHSVCMNLKGFLKLLCFYLLARSLHTEHRLKCVLVTHYVSIVNTG